MSSSGRWTIISNSNEDKFSEKSQGLKLQPVSREDSLNDPLSSVNNFQPLKQYSFDLEEKQQRVHEFLQNLSNSQDQNQSQLQDNKQEYRSQAQNDYNLKNETSSQVSEIVLSQPMQETTEDIIQSNIYDNTNIKVQNTKSSYKFEQQEDSLSFQDSTDGRLNQSSQEQEQQVQDDLESTAKMSSIQSIVGTNKQEKLGSDGLYGRSYRILVAGLKGVGKTTFSNWLSYSEQSKQVFSSVEKQPFNLIQYDSFQGDKNLLWEEFSAKAYYPRETGVSTIDLNIQEIPINLTDLTIDVVIQKIQELDQSVQTNNSRYNLPIDLCIYMVNPFGNTKRDVKYMKIISENIAVLPIISKADLLSQSELKEYQMELLEDLKGAKVEYFELPWQLIRHGLDTQKHPFLAVCEDQFQETIQQQAGLDFTVIQEPNDCQILQHLLITQGKRLYKTNAQQKVKDLFDSKQPLQTGQHIQQNISKKNELAQDQGLEPIDGYNSQAQPQNKQTNDISCNQQQSQDSEVTIQQFPSRWQNIYKNNNSKELKEGNQQKVPAATTGLKEVQNEGLDKQVLGNINEQSIESKLQQSPAIQSPSKQFSDTDSQSRQQINQQADNFFQDNLNKFPKLLSPWHYTSVNSSFLSKQATKSKSQNVNDIQTKSQIPLQQAQSQPQPQPQPKIQPQAELQANSGTELIDSQLNEKDNEILSKFNNSLRSSILQKLQNSQDKWGFTLDNDQGNNSNTQGALGNVNTGIVWERNHNRGELELESIIKEKEVLRAELRQDRQMQDSLFAQLRENGEASPQEILLQLSFWIENQENNLTSKIQQLQQQKQDTNQSISQQLCVMLEKVVKKLQAQKDDIYDLLPILEDKQEILKGLREPLWKHLDKIYSTRIHMCNLGIPLNKINDGLAGNGCKSKASLNSQISARNKNKKLVEQCKRYNQILEISLKFADTQWACEGSIQTDLKNFLESCDLQADLVITLSNTIDGRLLTMLEDLQIQYNRNRFVINGCDNLLKYFEQCEVQQVSRFERSCLQIEVRAKSRSLKKELATLQRYLPEMQNHSLEYKKELDKSWDRNLKSRIEHKQILDHYNDLLKIPGLVAKFLVKESRPYNDLVLAVNQCCSIIKDEVSYVMNQGINDCNSSQISNSSQKMLNANQGYIDKSLDTLRNTNQEDINSGQEIAPMKQFFKSLKFQDHNYESICAKLDSNKFDLQSEVDSELMVALNLDADLATSEINSEIDSQNDEAKEANDTLDDESEQESDVCSVDSETQFQDQMKSNVDQSIVNALERESNNTESVNDEYKLEHIEKGIKDMEAQDILKYRYALQNNINSPFQEAGKGPIIADSKNDSITQSYKVKNKVSSNKSIDQELDNLKQELDNPNYRIYIGKQESKSQNVDQELETLLDELNNKNYDKRKNLQQSGESCQVQKAQSLGQGLGIRVKPGDVGEIEGLDMIIGLKYSGGYTNDTQSEYEKFLAQLQEASEVPREVEDVQSGEKLLDVVCKYGISEEDQLYIIGSKSSPMCKLCESKSYQGRQSGLNELNPILETAKKHNSIDIQQQHQQLQGKFDLLRQTALKLFEQGIWKSNFTGFQKIINTLFNLSNTTSDYHNTFQSVYRYISREFLMSSRVYDLLPNEQAARKQCVKLINRALGKQKLKILQSVSENLAHQNMESQVQTNNHSREFQLLQNYGWEHVPLCVLNQILGNNLEDALRKVTQSGQEQIYNRLIKSVPQIEESEPKIDSLLLATNLKKAVRASKLSLDLGNDANTQEGVQEFKVNMANDQRKANIQLKLSIFQKLYDFINKDNILCAKLNELNNLLDNLEGTLQQKQSFSKAASQQDFVDIQADMQQSSQGNTNCENSESEVKVYRDKEQGELLTVTGCQQEVSYNPFVNITQTPNPASIYNLNDMATNTVNQSQPQPQSQNDHQVQANTNKIFVLGSNNHINRNQSQKQQTSIQDRDIPQFWDEAKEKLQGSQAQAQQPCNLHGFGSKQIVESIDQEYVLNQQGNFNNRISQDLNSQPQIWGGDISQFNFWSGKDHQNSFAFKSKAMPSAPQMKEVNAGEFQSIPIIDQKLQHIVDEKAYPNRFQNNPLTTPISSYPVYFGESEILNKSMIGNLNDGNRKGTVQNEVQLKYVDDMRLELAQVKRQLEECQRVVQEQSAIIQEHQGIGENMEGLAAAVEQLEKSTIEKDLQIRDVEHQKFMLQDQLTKNLLMQREDQDLLLNCKHTLHTFDSFQGQIGNDYHAQFFKDNQISGLDFYKNWCVVFKDVINEVLQKNVNLQGQKSGQIANSQANLSRGGEIDLLSFQEEASAPTNNQRQNKPGYSYEANSEKLHELCTQISNLETSQNNQNEELKGLKQYAEALEDNVDQLNRQLNSCKDQNYLSQEQMKLLNNANQDLERELLDERAIQNELKEYINDLSSLRNRGF